MNSLKIAAALRVLANAFEADEDQAPAQPTQESGTQKRGRGRPVKGEDQAPLAATTAAVAPAQTTPAQTAVVQETADPFDTAPAAPTATLDDVRKALTTLRAASDQASALKVLNDAGGSANLNDLKPEKYGTVVAAVNVQLRILENTKPEPVAESDPFEVSASVAAAPAAKVYTLEDVKSVAVAAGKRTSQDTVQKVVMAHGGKATQPTGGEGPSLKALPESQYAAVIAAIQALPATK